MSIITHAGFYACAKRILYCMVQRLHMFLLYSLPVMQ